MSDEQNTQILDDETSWEEIAELLELEEDAATELEDYIRDPWSMRGIVIKGNLNINGDTSTVALASGQFANDAPFAGDVEAAHTAYINAMASEEYDGHQEDYVVVVLGDLTITGALEVVQHRPLYVAGDLRVKTVSAHTGNVVVTGTLNASEMILCAANEEGGLIWSPTIDTPLMVDAQQSSGVWLQVNGEMQFTEDLTKLLEVLSQVLGQAVESHDVYFPLADAIKNGRAGEIVAAYVEPTKA